MILIESRFYQDSYSFKLTFKQNKPLVGQIWQAELAMWDEPNTKISCQRKYSSVDPRKGVDSSKQQDGGHGSRHPLRSVQQHTCRMNRPRKWMALKHITPIFGQQQFIYYQNQ
eukprot:TRINITY_DN2267_c0_g1_i2.p1 TRINITY_DN2267_c0_g1~~TRINITY_DN2267_c0_g1_i2.p1  ORF type:complete len:113 (+),score=1.06 TRINITY_DN2267_c0_g1_i2:81-419(+)